METQTFNQFFDEFKSAAIDDKIDMYCSTPDLTKDQYKEMLRTFSADEMKKLEMALS